jgi:serine O-acetyltransferase
VDPDDPMSLTLSLSAEQLTDYVVRQLEAVIPDGVSIARPGVLPHVVETLDRLEYCFSRINGKYFCEDGRATFDHLHTDQYAMFLYLLSNQVHRADGDRRLASKLYALNKALHALDVYFEVELPDVFAFQHPVGSVLGRGTYGNYFFVYQRCSIGANLEGEYPTLGEGVVMFGGSAVIGASTVAPNSWLSVGAVVMDADVPPNSVVFGHAPHLTCKPTGRNVVRDMFLRS